MDDALTREREFHDRLAAELNLGAVPPRPPEELDVALLNLLGDIRGRRVLDLGCGGGDLTLELVARGAHVTALDISPGMVAATRDRVTRYSDARNVEFVAAPAHEVPVEDGSFDLVVGRWILHHVEIAELSRELARILKPGARAAFIENSGLNPILRFAREKLTGRFGIRRVGTPDEHPLVGADYETFGRYFGRVVATYPNFDFFTIFDRQILRFRWPRVSRVLRGADRAIYRFLPPLRKYSFRVIVELAQPLNPAR